MMVVVSEKKTSSWHSLPFKCFQTYYDVSRQKGAALLKLGCTPSWSLPCTPWGNNVGRPQPGIWGARKIVVEIFIRFSFPYFMMWNKSRQKCRVCIQFRLLYNLGYGVVQPEQNYFWQIWLCVACTYLQLWYVTWKCNDSQSYKMRKKKDIRANKSP